MGRSKNHDHLIIQDNKMICLDCGEEYPLVRARIITVTEIVDAFMRAHDKMGCSYEKYLSDKERSDKTS